MLLKKIKFLDDYKIQCQFTTKETVIWNAKKSLIRNRPIWNTLKEESNFKNLHIEDGVLVYRFSDEENDYFDICPDLIYMEGKSCRYQSLIL